MSTRAASVSPRADACGCHHTGVLCLAGCLMSLGTGGALVALVSAFPQLVWRSERRILLFGVATGLLVASGVTPWRAGVLPYPADPVLVRRCGRLRRMSNVPAVGALLSFCFRAVFAFMPPALRG